ncbi:FkbM family methyltransferase [Cognatiyoonia sp. IB215182]|uniref:FkbM family methyltransferase n=1 Tax=Cognatiyoonia sp. IB215182 TaxID=3097353 RepID=UPI002A146744|nr:FkbM family methyltransferase [Cognatiyoonia sp. IB215182]MDX8354663.1 FkbM family methyltransferase [Cognatiyoonia sp. IB215182]
MADVGVLCRDKVKEHTKAHYLRQLERQVNERLAVYTNVLGWGYELPPVTPFQNVDYICFTDQKIKTPNGWTCVSVTPFLEADPFRSSREQKIRPHRWLKQHDKSLYIDSTVLLRQDPHQIWEKLVPNDNIVFGGLFHSFRESVAGEFSAALKYNLEHQHVLDEHVAFYEEYYSEVLHQRPVWGGLLARRHNDSHCIEAMEKWHAHVLRYSRRDQLSLPAALTAIPPKKVNIVSENIKNSEFHKWPHGRLEKPPYQTVKGPAASNAFSTTAQTKTGEPAVTQDPQSQNIPQPTHKCIFGFDEERRLFFAQDRQTGKQVFVSDRARLSLYRRGIFRRRKQLVSDYRLPRDLITKDDVVIDVGANIGEIGMWCNDKGGSYYAFEPDPSAYAALRENVIGECYDVALSDSNGTAEFFLNTESADSSLFKPDKHSGVISVDKVRLDDFEPISGLAKIKLLKVEAEGMEPEVLRGAENTLKKVEYIAIDAGAERGGENTVPEVLNFLTDRRFKILACFLTRGTFLLRSKSFE